MRARCLLRGPATASILYGAAAAAAAAFVPPLTSTTTNCHSTLAPSSTSLVHPQNDTNPKVGQKQLRAVAVFISGHQSVDTHHNGWEMDETGWVNWFSTRATTRVKLSVDPRDGEREKRYRSDHQTTRGISWEVRSMYVAHCRRAAGLRC